MAKSFKELGKKAETLIEQGRSADQKVQAFQSSVSAATRQVAIARSQLASARETDENGQPKGNVEQAQAQLNIAQNKLAASQRALAGAQKEADQIKQQKTAHAREIETHNRIERENIEKLKKLSSGPFAADAVSLTRGMAERFNEAEETRAALLRSMGIEAAPDHIPLDGALGAEIGWKTGGFGPLDLTGRAMSVQGGEAAFIAPGLIGNDDVMPTSKADYNFEPDPAGQASPQEKKSEPGFDDRKTQDRRSSENDRAIGESLTSGQVRSLMQMIERITNNHRLSYADKRMLLESIKRDIQDINSYLDAEMLYEREGEMIKVLRLSNERRREMGMQYIDQMMDAYRSNLRSNGAEEGKGLQAVLARERSRLEKILQTDIERGRYTLDACPLPDFKQLAVAAQLYDAGMISGVDELEISEASVFQDLFSSLGSKSDTMRDEMWNEKYLPLVKMNIRQSVKTYFSDYVTEEKMESSLSSLSFMDQRELSRRYGAGFQKGTLGFNDGESSNIANDISQPTRNLQIGSMNIQGSQGININFAFVTAVHENLHMMSANDSDIRRRGIMVGGDEQSRAMNEAITEYFTFLSCGGERPNGGLYPGEYSGYTTMVREIPVIERAIGRSTLAEAYFKNKPELIENAVDSIVGRGSWRSLCEASYDLFYNDGANDAAKRILGILDILKTT